MVTMKIYVEGGGDGKALKIQCREGFSKFMERAGLSGHMPRVVACGPRSNAYACFMKAVRNRERALLLVDSEGSIPGNHQHGEPEEWTPWDYLRSRDGDQWEKPGGAGEMDCHLMVQCMESWILMDRAVLQGFFGQGFNVNDLPAEQNSAESIAKDTVLDSLERSTRRCKTKAKYGKGEHSFKLLALIDPLKVYRASPWAKRFIDETKRRMGC